MSTTVHSRNEDRDAHLKHLCSKTLRAKEALCRVRAHRSTKGLRMEGICPWSTCGPVPLLRQDHLEQAAQGHVQMAFEYLQRCTTRCQRCTGDSTTSLDNLCHCSVTLTVKSASWYSEGTSGVSLCACCLSVGTTEKSLTPPPLHLAFRYCYTWRNHS